MAISRRQRLRLGAEARRPKVQPNLETTMAQPNKPHDPSQPMEPRRTEDRRAAEQKRLDPNATEAERERLAREQAQGRGPLLPKDPKNPGRNPVQDPHASQAVSKIFGEGTDGDGGDQAERIRAQARAFAEVIVKETSQGAEQTELLTRLRTLTDDAIQLAAQG